MVSHFVTGHSCADMRRYLLHPSVIVQDFMIIFPDDEDAGGWYCMYDFLVFVLIHSLTFIFTFIRILMSIIPYFYLIVIGSF